jgi:hypothetical protein
MGAALKTKPATEPINRDARALAAGGYDDEPAGEDQGPSVLGNQE